MISNPVHNPAYAIGPPCGRDCSEILSPARSSLVADHLIGNMPLLVSFPIVEARSDRPLQIGVAVLGMH